jgi:subfamily B ATP-binding cassette protein MsbA
MFNAYMPLKRMGYVYQQFQAAQGVSQQVFAYLDREEEAIDQAGGKTLGKLNREIAFENVTFAYDPISTPVLQNIWLRARKGEVVALVGTSGAGKTTLVNLIPRFYELTGGRIQIDGVDIREVTLRSLRAQIAMVTQENILFHDTVLNNICYGMSGVPRERVVQAAQAALAHDFIMDLPQGYDTVIGERGTRLSGGQRQRVAIARAILKDSPILILDEATSELDSESEMYVQKALSNLMEGRTVFVVAHRLGTIKFLYWRRGRYGKAEHIQSCWQRAGAMRGCTNCSLPTKKYWRRPRCRTLIPLDRAIRDERKEFSRSTNLDGG